MLKCGAALLLFSLWVRSIFVDGQSSLLWTVDERKNVFAVSSRNQLRGGTTLVAKKFMNESLEWTQPINGLGSIRGLVYDPQTEGLVVAGDVRGHMYLTKLATNGAIVWAYRSEVKLSNPRIHVAPRRVIVHGCLREVGWLLVLDSSSGSLMYQISVPSLSSVDVVAWNEQLESLFLASSAQELLIKVSLSGELIWSRPTPELVVKAVAQVSDERLLLVALRGIKLEGLTVAPSSGELLWSSTLLSDVQAVEGDQLWATGEAVELLLYRVGESTPSIISLALKVQNALSVGPSSAEHVCIDGRCVLVPAHVGALSIRRRLASTTTGLVAGLAVAGLFVLGLIVGCTMWMYYYFFDPHPSMKYSPKKIYPGESCSADESDS